MPRTLCDIKLKLRELELVFEAQKIRESEYFFQRMVQDQTDFDNFMFNLSAFLSSTRSVFQYVLEEAKTKKGGKKWYDSAIAGSHILQYFKEKRDANIHIEPIKPWIQFDIYTSNISVLVTLPRTESPEEKQRYQDTTSKALLKLSNRQELSTEEKELLDQCIIKPEKVDATYEQSYTFCDWPGPENALKLCEMYINVLKDIVNEGQIKGFLTA
jgi:hypothetical protein